MKIYWANFSHGLRMQKGVVHRRRDQIGPRSRVGRPARSDRPSGVSAAVLPGFSPVCSFSTSFFGQKILREV
jgi:hypothetical protein